jgi:hypothetical protein
MLTLENVENILLPPKLSQSSTTTTTSRLD